jgi:hypothetical protein
LEARDSRSGDTIADIEGIRRARRQVTGSHLGPFTRRR